ncbi:MAG: hypothetical protein JXP34_09030 [Planctomycetes bacterium]|nr:hypothetical protein [Planctomycetota bacterium]
MDDRETRKGMEASRVEAREDGIFSMLREFYTRRMLSVAIVVWGSAIIMLALAVLCAVQFFQSEETRYQVMYAALFVCFMQWAALPKVFAWQVLHNNRIKREIQRVEVRILDEIRTLKAG